MGYHHTITTATAGAPEMPSKMYLHACRVILKSRQLIEADAHIPKNLQGVMTLLCLIAKTGFSSSDLALFFEVSDDEIQQWRERAFHHLLHDFKFAAAFHRIRAEVKA